MSQYLELGARSVSDLTSAEAEIHQTKADIINSNYTVSNLAMESLYYAGKLINLMKKIKDDIVQDMDFFFLYGK